MLLRILLLLTLLVPLQAMALEFTDDFEDGDLAGWECTNDLSNWFVTCSQTDNTAFCLLPFEPQASSAIRPEGLQWSDVEIDVDLRGIVGNDKIIRFRASETGDAYYSINLRADIEDLVFGKMEPATGWTLLEQVPVGNVNGIWYHIRIETEDGHIRVLVDDELVVDYVDPDPLPLGAVWFEGYVAESPTIAIQWDNVEIVGEGGPTPAVQSSWGGMKGRYR